ncbi:MAG TPA: protein kinase [Planctomycetaceae bacterium]|nr:protein kinase [Planctomycetaceae bacterium]
MNERTIFLTALDKTEPAERSAWLDESCGGDPGLRGRVEDLLRVYNDAGSFLEHSPLEVPPTVPGETSAAADETPGGVSAFDATRVGTDLEHELSLRFLGPPREPGGLGSLGPYDITEIVGRGGMGVVLKGHDTRLNRVVAVKVLAPELASNATARKRFMREAQAAAAVSHDHVVTIHAIDDTGGLPYIVMEYIAGLSLQQRIDRSGPLELKEILRIGRQMASGLAAAHEQGLVHRDIKPANILLENGVERVKITDFGLARAVDDVSMTQTGVVAGTPQYMSPEQAQGHHVDHRSDLFSLGSVLYAMCTGRPPFRADSTIAVIRRVCDDRPRPIAQINAEIPEWLAAIIERLLEKRPEDRFQSAAQVAELLGRCLAHVQQPGLVALPEVPDGANAADSLPAGVGQPESALPRAGEPPAFYWKPRLAGSRWVAAASLVLVPLVAFGLTETTGVTQVVPTIVRVLTGEGTLVVEIDDPAVSVHIDGEDLVVKGAGVHEVRVTPGKHQVQALKDGRPVREELVSISRGGKQVIRIQRDPRDSQPADVPVAVAKPELRQQWTSLIEAARKATTDAERKRLIEQFSPVLAELGDEAGRQVLELIAGLPDETHREFLDRGYLKWPFGLLDERRQQAHRELLERLLNEARQLGFGGNQTAAQSAGDVLGQSNVGFAVVDVGRTGTQVITWYVLMRDLPVPVAIPIVGITAENESEYRRSLVEHALKLQDQPDTVLVPAGPASGASRGSSRRIVEIRRFGELHTRPLTDLAYLPSAEGRLVATSSYDGTVRIWDVDTGTEARPFLHHDEQVQSLAVAPDGQTIVTGTCSGVGGQARWSVSVADVASGTIRHTLATGQGYVYDLAFSHDGGRLYVATAYYPDGGGSSGAVAVYDTASWERLCEFENVKQAVQEVAPLRQQARVLAGGEYHMGGVWDSETGRLLASFRDLPATPHAISPSPDGAVAAIGFAVNKFRDERFEDPDAPGIWLCDVETGRLIRKLRGHTGFVNDVAWSADGRFLVSGSGAHHTGRGFFQSWDSTLRVWDARTGAEVARVEVDTEWGVWSLALLPDGRHVVTAGADGNRPDLRLWRLPESVWPQAESEPAAITELRRFQGHDSVAALAFLPDGQTFLSAGSENTIRWWDAQNGQQIGRIGTPGTTARCLAVSPDGTRVAAGHYNGVVGLWAIATGEPIWQSSGHSGSVEVISFVADSRQILTGGLDKTVRLWDVGDGTQARQFSSDGAIAALAVSPDGRQALLCAEAGAVVLMDIETGEAIRRMSGFDGNAKSAAFSPDGRYALAGATDRTIRLWNVETGQEVRRFEGHADAVTSVHFSPGGRFLLSGGWDRTLRMWDVESGREVARLPAQTQCTQRLALSADGRHVAGGGGRIRLSGGQGYTNEGDGAVRLWRLPKSAWPEEDGQRETSTLKKPVRLTRVRWLAQQKTALYGAVFSPDGRQALSWTGPADNARLWELASGRLVHEFAGPLQAGAFTPDGRRVLLGTHHTEDAAPNRLLVFDAESGRELLSLEASTGIFMDIEVSPDGRFAVSGHAQWWDDMQQQDHMIRVWDLAEGRLARVIDGHSYQVLAVAWSPDGRSILSGSRDGTVRLWNAETGEEIRRFEGTGTEAFSVAYSRDGRFVLAGYGPDPEHLDETRIDDPQNCVALLWDVETGREIRRFTGHRGCINAVDVSPDGRLVLTASGGQNVGPLLPGGSNRRETFDNSVRLWDAATGRELARISHRTSVRTAEFSRDGQHVLTGEIELVQLWKLPETILDADPHLEAAKSAGATGPRQLLVSSDRGGDYEIYLIDENGQGWTNLTNHPAEDTGPAWSPNGSQIAFTSLRSGNYDVWLMDADGSNVRQLTDDPGIDRTPAWSPDGERIVFVRHLPEDDNWELFMMKADGSEAVNLSNHPFREADPAWSPDGSQIAFSVQSQWGAWLYVMNADGSESHRLARRKGSYVYPAWSADASQIVFTAHADDSEDLELFVINADGSSERQLTALGGMSTFAAWSPDGETIAFQHRNPNKPGAGATIHLINPDGTGLRAITGPEAPSRYGGGRPAWRPLPRKE